MNDATRGYLQRARAELARQCDTCLCGSQMLVGWLGDVEDNCRVAVCKTGEHITVDAHPGALRGKVYVHVENPEDVIEAAT